MSSSLQATHAFPGNTVCRWYGTSVVLICELMFMQGPFSSFEDTLLTITGGAGLFREAKGVIHLHNITPFKLFYTFHVRGVPELPKILTASPVEPNEFVHPCREAAACKAGFTLPNYTD